MLSKDELLDIVAKQIESYVLQKAINALVEKGKYPMTLQDIADQVDQHFADDLTKLREMLLSANPPIDGTDEEKALYIQNLGRTIDALQEHIATEAK